MLDDSIEEWRPVERTRGIYEVSNWGRVRRAINGLHTYAGRILNPRGEPYLHVYFRIGGREVTPNVHALVAEAFLGPRPAGYTHINHIDANTKNNRATNLEWQTPRGNVQHSYALGRRVIGWNGSHAKGEAVNRARLTEAAVRFIRSPDHGLTTAELARRFNVTWSAVAHVQTGRSWKHVI